MNTLYISDLDGTLLDQDALLSESTFRSLSQIIASNIHFTCATARTAATVTHLLHGLKLSAPAILMNGAAILDLNTNRYVKVEYLEPSFSKAFIQEMHQHNLTGFIYCIETDSLKTYYETLYNASMYQFCHERITRYHKCFPQVESLNDVNADAIVSALLLDTRETLQPLNDWLCSAKNQYDIDFCFYPETYLKNTWCLEIFSNKATKHNAAQFIREKYGYDRLVGFGDNLNDLSLFEACDECYAVENAKDDVKAAATATIGSNLNNSVAQFILERECSIDTTF